MTVDVVQTSGPRLTTRFAPDLERAFQARYYAGTRNALRIVAALLAALILVSAAFMSLTPAPYDAAVILPQVLFWLLLFGLTWVRGFERVWQPVIVLLGWTAAALVLGELAHQLAAEVRRGQGVTSDVPTLVQQKFYFVLQFVVLMVSLATLRLHLAWAALLHGGVLAIGVWAYRTGLSLSPYPLILDLRFALLPGLLVFFAVLLAAFVQEQLARNVFLTNYLLDQERNEERRKRERTEAMLQILSQAIGGIVHDLGNPLTSVQTGAETLEMFLEGDDTDKELLKEFTAMIQDGARMLNYLRLSLMEQTRVLEGKPIPVERRPASVRRMIEAGARYQKPKFLSGRQIVLVGEDLAVRVDEMKMITVFMNLIGNALKYSDGEVRVAWRTQDDTLRIAILDQGRGGKGITEAQARRLFTAFGRLETHAAIEGTGLGLLSVRKIVEAHGGEVFVEGREDGTPSSPSFTTARGAYPTMLVEDFRTAFVIAISVSERVQEGQ